MKNLKTLFIFLLLSFNSLAQENDLRIIIKNKKHGILKKTELDFSQTIEYYHLGEKIYSENRVPDQKKEEPKYPWTYKVKIEYDSLQNPIKMIHWDLDESTNFYKDGKIKSTILKTQNEFDSAYTYLKFDTIGNLRVKGYFADSFMTTVDTIVEFVYDLKEEWTTVKVERYRFKNRTWFHYSPKGILLREVTYKYKMEREKL